jgi:hypothetical protein
VENRGKKLHLEKTYEKKLKKNLKIKKTEKEMV